MKQYTLEELEAMDREALEESASQLIDQVHEYQRSRKKLAELTRVHKALMDMVEHAKRT